MKDLKFIKTVFVLVLFFGGLYHVNASEECRDRPMVKIDNGVICGTYVYIPIGDNHKKKKVQKYTKIPYAETLTPENRWKAPVKKGPFKGNYLDASQECPKCPQSGDSKLIQEDCLYLNVWASADAKPGSNYPVMVFIHGGAFLFGSGGSPIFDSSYITALRKVVVVTINYRLGVLGFLVNHGKETVSGNFGLMDQKLALQWVRDNIHAFGGDKKNVTIFGESAGAMSIGFHLMMKDQSHFDAAIMESNPYSLPCMTEDEAAGLGKEFLCLMDCEDIQCLRTNTISWNSIVNIGDIIEGLAIVTYGLKGILCWKPVICDKTFDFKSQPINAIPDKPVIIGTNTNEGIMFVSLFDSALKNALAKWMKTEVEKIEKQSYDDNLEHLIDLLFREKKYKEKISAFVKKGHESKSKGIIDSIFASIITDFCFTSGNLYYDKNAVEKGSDLFAYYFTHVSSCNPIPKIPACADKVCHSAELPYVFHSFKVVNPGCYDKITKAEKALSNQMIEYWTKFATFKNPNGPIQCKNKKQGPFCWPKYQPGDQLMIDLNLKMATIKLQPDFYWFWKLIIEDVNAVKCQGQSVKSKKKPRK